MRAIQFRSKETMSYNVSNNKHFKREPMNPREQFEKETGMTTGIMFAHLLSVFRAVY